MSRKVLAPAVILALVLTIARLVAPHASGTPLIAVFFPGPVRFFEVELAAMQAEAKAQDLRLVSFDAGWNPADQMRQVDDASHRGFRLLALVAVDANVAVGAVEIARNAKVPLVTFTNSVGDDPEGKFDGVVTHIGRNEYVSGQLLAGQIANLSLVHPRIASVEGAPGTSPQRLRSEGFLEVASAHPNWTVADRVQIADWRLDRVEYEVTRLLDEGHVDVIAVQWAEGAVTAARLVAASRRTDVVVVSLEWTKDLVEQIRAGRVSSSTYSSVRDEGATAVKTFAAVVRGEPVAPFVSIPQRIVTAEEAVQFAPEW